MGWSKKNFIIHIIFCAIIVLIAPTQSIAQKNKNKGNNSASKLRDAEYYFTEGEKYFILEDYAKALVLFQKSLDVAPDNATVHYKIAQIYAAGQEMDKALINIKKALDSDPDNKYFYVLAGEIHTQMGDFKNAASTYEQMTSTIEDTDQYLFELAAIYLYQQDYDKAVEVYDRIEKHYGPNEDVISQKQKIYLSNKEFDKALQEGQKLIDTYPEEEQFVLNQAEVLLSNNKTEEARILLKNFSEQNPDNSMKSRLVLSELDRKEGDMEGAIANMEIAFKDPSLDIQEKIQILAEYRVSMTPEELKNSGVKLAELLVEAHPEVADSHIIYADILQTVGELPLAKDAYLKSLELDQSNFAVWQNILQIFIQQNKMDSVLLFSDQALELFPNQGSLYYFNGYANLRKQNYQEAVYALEQGKRLSSSNLSLVSAFNSMLGDAYNGTEQFAKSDKAYEAALDFDPENYAILNNYSYFLALRKEKLDEAEKMAAKTVKNNPDNATYLDTYAWVLFTNGKYKEAKKIIEQAINTGEVTAVFHEHYGDILYKLGQVDAAVKQWQKAKEMNPKSELIDKKIADRKLYE
ncbi:tetratricopeptide repeat protein [Fulvivirga maritima]|uniref:tetratricopeptide repeat protein n=1 Tax=Fulvivirga maritima TaxID=2904247 RepID=UPI001F456E78|nr:tetratricopeptide repeat protein [Fulvivirga maritima]UII27739.1 tetratricopeptide repeat protein [Fulvivirga maritima]